MVIHGVFVKVPGSHASHAGHAGPAGATEPQEVTVSEYTQEKLASALMDLEGKGRLDIFGHILNKIFEK